MENNNNIIIKEFFCEECNRYTKHEYLFICKSKFNIDNYVDDLSIYTDV